MSLNLARGRAVSSLLRPLRVLRDGPLRCSGRSGRWPRRGDVDVVGLGGADHWRQGRGRYPASGGGRQVPRRVAALLHRVRRLPRRSASSGGGARSQPEVPTRPGPQHARRARTGGPGPAPSRQRPGAPDRRHVPRVARDLVPALRRRAPSPARRVGGAGQRGPAPITWSPSPPRPRSCCRAAGSAGGRRARSSTRPTRRSSGRRAVIAAGRRVDRFASSTTAGSPAATGSSR